MLPADKNDTQIQVDTKRSPHTVYHFNKRLLDSLNSIFKTPITIISAPIGYGKTTAIREYLYRTNAAISWISIYSNSAEDFWKNFCQAMPCNNDVSSGFMGHGFPHDRNAVLQMVNFIEKIDFQHETALVIDDYHLIKNEEITSFILALAKKAIPRFHIVIATRVNFPYDDELLLGGYVNLITASVFALEKEDVRRYFEKYNIEISDDKIQVITRFTEGWISALHIIALAALHNINVGDNITEIIDESGLSNSIMRLAYQPLPENCKQFLYSMCCLADFSREQAEYIWSDFSEDMPAKEILNLLVSKNAFIRYDESKGRYHMHYLFCRVVRMNFDKLPCGLKRQYMIKMGRWYALKKDDNRAINYFCQAEYYDGIYELLSKSRVWYYADENIPMLIGSYKVHRPENTIMYFKGMLTLASKMYSLNEQETYHEILSYFVDLLKPEQHIGKTEKDILWAEYEILQCLPDCSDMEAIKKHINRACELCPENENITHRLDWLFGCPSILLLYYQKPGFLNRFSEEFTCSIEQYGRLAQYDAAAMVYFLKAEIKFYRCRFDDAEILLYCALRLAKKNNDYSLWVACCFLKARILIFEGNPDEAFAVMREATGYINQNLLSELIKTVDICTAWLHLFLGQPEYVAKWLCNLEEAEKAMPKQVIPAVRLVNGAWLVLNRFYTEYISYSVDRSGNDNCSNVISGIYQKLCLSAAYSNINRMDEAAACYVEAVEIAMSDGLCLPFVEFAASLTVVADRITDERYIEFMKTVKENSRAVQYALNPALLQKTIQSGNVLTKREREIAELVQNGLKNMEIAKRLYISENTVKSALKLIFKKLDISSRKELQAKQKPPGKTTRLATR